MLSKRHVLLELHLLSDDAPTLFNFQILDAKRDQNII